MKHLASILWPPILALLCGCGGGESTAGPPPQVLNIAGNWQFSTTSTVGMPAAAIAGSITQSGSSVNGAVHVDGSNCFDRATTVSLAGSLSGSNVSLTSTSVAGQVINFTGSATENAINGTYTINGGCADGDRGNVTAFKVAAFSGTWRSGFEINDQHFYGLATVTQDSTSSEGSFGVAGTVDDSSDVSCLTGTMTAGTFPSPSFIMGTSVAFEIKTDDGKIVFEGTMKQDGSEITGTHHIVGGACGNSLGYACFGRDFHSLCRLP